MEKKRIYYYLPKDGYGQPNGIIEQKELTKKEFEEMKDNQEYIYKDYYQALSRAQD